LVNRREYARYPFKKVRKRDTINFKLYLITDRKLIRDTRSLITAVRDALKGGVKAIQLREKDLDTQGLLRLAYRMRDLTGRYKAKLFINDRLDIALAVGADGVHLTQQSIPVDAVRKVVHDSCLIGVSTHSLEEAKEAERGGADFITLGPIFRTPSKLRYGSPLGVEILKQASHELHIPVFAIGGIKAGRIGSVMGAGASGVAMISEVFTADNIMEKVKDIMGILDGIKQA